MSTAAPLLEVSGLTVEFSLPGKTIRAVDNASFQLGAGEVLGIVGESGSGKTVLARSLMRLVHTPPGRYAAGSIRFEGEDLLQKSEAEMRALRSGRIAMIFQEPMTALNPVLTIGYQVGETLRLHENMSAARANAAAVELLRRVRVADPERRVAEYPHQLSGGMRQRAMIAMALARRPRLLIADEPTTALDVTIQAQILALLRELRTTSGISVILISHNLGVVADIADRVMVVYAGSPVECAPTRAVFRTPQHPYTTALLAAIPRLDRERRRLDAIDGSLPALDALPVGCRFHPRCPLAIATCRERDPPLVNVAPGHLVKCWRAVPPGGAA